jgi:hypothetical protein
VERRTLDRPPGRLNCVGHWAEPLFDLGFVRQKDWAGLDTIFYLYIFSNSFLHPLNQKKSNSFLQTYVPIKDLQNYSTFARDENEWS